jgi:hypothetical protein
MPQPTHKNPEVDLNVDDFDGYPDDTLIYAFGDRYDFITHDDDAGLISKWYLFDKPQLGSVKTYDNFIAHNTASSYRVAYDCVESVVPDDWPTLAEIVLSIMLVAPDALKHFHEAERAAFAVALQDRFDKAVEQYAQLTQRALERESNFLKRFKEQAT